MKSGFFKAVSGSMAVRIASTSVLLVTSIFLARVLGPAGFGAYTFAFSILGFAFLLAQLGIPELTVREVSQRLALGRSALLARFLRIAWIGSLVISLIVAALTIIALAILDFGDAQVSRLILAGLPIIVCMPAISLAGAMIRATGRVVQGVLGPQLFRPAIFLGVLLIAYICDSRLTPFSVMLLHSLACFLIMLEGIVRAKRALPVLAGECTVAPERYRRWSVAAFMFSGIAVVHLINSKFDTIALGILTNDEQVGLYAVGVQMAQAAAAMLLITAAVVTPGVSKALALEDLDAAEQLCRKSARYSFGGAVAALVGFVVFGKWMVVTIFGAEYAPVWTATLILIAGQSANAFFGPVGILLNMRGEERSTFIATGAASLINVALNFLLIPLYGLAGAAIATAVAMLLWNILLWVRALLLIGVNTSAMPNWFRHSHSRQNENTSHVG